MEAPLRGDGAARAGDRSALRQQPEARRRRGRGARGRRHLDAGAHQGRGGRGPRRQGARRTGEHGRRHLRGPARQGAGHAGGGRAAGTEPPGGAGGPGDQAHRHARSDPSPAAAPRRAHGGGLGRGRHHSSGEGGIMTVRLRRSELATPASNWKKIEKAAASDADLAFLDLEDAVAPAEKEGARGNVVRALRELDWGRKLRAVRVNGADTRWAHDDVLTVVAGAGDRLDLLILPKVKAPRDVWFFEALIEEAAALARVEEIAACSPRLEALILGFGDLSASQGVRLALASTYPGDLWHYARTRMIVAARAHGLDAIDGPFANFRDPEGYRREGTWASTLGAVGKWAIHPSQLEIANDVFAPTEAEIALAQRMCDAYRAAEQGGAGAAGAGGFLVDAAAVRIFEAVLERARLTGRA